MMMSRPAILVHADLRDRAGYSLVEVLVCLVIAGLIVALAAPRMSRGAVGTADAALARDLRVLRKAIDLYAVEHGGSFPTVANIEDQLERYTNVSGVVSKKKTGAFIYGPYIHNVPSVAAGPTKGKSKIGPAPASNVGWIYDQATGDIRVSATNETDANGRKYADY